MRFDSADRGVRALDSVSFAATENEFLSVVGPSGCGKSTLLRILAGILEPTSGAVEFAARGSAERLRTALVFQEHGLLPWCTVLENVALGLELRGVPRADRERAAHAFVAAVGLERFTGAYPHELSVGMRQRVALARAFVSDAEILLLDEPFGALDAQTRAVLQQELMRIWRDHRHTVVHVTHDIEEAILLGDRVLVMSGRPGRILEILAVPLPRPREPRAMDRPEIRDLKWHVWQLLEREVRGSLGLAGSP
ncbi:MAG TPA: ABC transporter ATP-binding protein [Thermoanaerobaculia bacterium]